MLLYQNSGGELQILTLNCLYQKMSSFLNGLPREVNVLLLLQRLGSFYLRTSESLFTFVKSLIK